MVKNLKLEKNADNLGATFGGDSFGGGGVALEETAENYEEKYAGRVRCQQKSIAGNSPKIRETKMEDSTQT